MVLHAPRIVLVATMRNEGPFILEWLAHHKAIGFTDILICTNDCIDGSPDLLDHLEAMDLIRHLRNSPKPGEKAQLAAYALAAAHPVVTTADWVMVLDADEFLNIHVGTGRVTDLIAAAPEATAFLVNWRLFGNANHRHWCDGFVIERFNRAARLADPVNLSFKTLFTGLDAYQCKLLPHQPRFPYPERLDTLRYVNGDGALLPCYFFDESRDAFLQMEPALVSWRLAQVNHYNTRSWEDYLVKHQRGGGLDIEWARDESWAIFNKNDEKDATIMRGHSAMKALYDGFLADPEVRRRHACCVALYREHIAALKRNEPRDV